jgi:hypothetical protein
MDPVQQARYNFEHAVGVLLETEEQIKAEWRLTPRLYNHWITAKLQVWLTVERWRKLRLGVGDSSATMSGYPVQLKYGLGIRPASHL